MIQIGKKTIRIYKNGMVDPCIVLPCVEEGKKMKVIAYALTVQEFEHGKLGDGTPMCAGIGFDANTAIAELRRLLSKDERFEIVRVA